jgi:hypothetical protein
LQKEFAVNARYVWIGSAAMLLTMGCASGGTQDQGDPGLSPSQQVGECGGRYEIQVQNDTYNPVEVFFMRSATATAERAGEVNARDTRSFFVRSPALFEIWAQVGPIRVLVRDQSSQQRTKVYLGVACGG